MALPVMAVISGIGTAVKTASFLLDVYKEVNGADSKVEQELKALRQGQEEIINQLSVIFHEIKNLEIITQISSSVQDIVFQYNQMLEFTKDHESAALKWAEKILDSNSGIEKDLSIVYNLIMGKDTLSLPIMQIYTDRIKANKTTQSQHYEAMAYFRVLEGLQERAFIVLANAYVLKNNGDEGLTTFLEPYNNWFQDQYSFNKKYIDPLDQWYGNKSAWRTNVFSINGDYHYVDTNENLAPKDHILTGLRLYLKGNRIGIEISTATVDSEGNVNPTPEQWIPSPGWGNQCFDIRDDHYVDTNYTMIPTGEVATGVKLYLKGNRMAIALQSAKINPETGAINNCSKKWIYTPPEDDSNYFSVDGDYHYVNTNDVYPNPSSYVVGASLYLLGNRIAVQVNTAFYTIK